MDVEFLLRQDISIRVVNDVLSSVSPPNNDFRMKMTILLRSIASAISNRPVEESFLTTLEMTEEVYYYEGKPALSSLKAAYCAVAVDCTVRFLEEQVENNGRYIAVAKRIWEERITKMEKADRKVDLLSDELVGRKEDIKNAIWDDDVQVKLRSIVRNNEAVQAVKIFMDEAWRDLGPSYLERLAEKMVAKDNEEPQRRKLPRSLIVGVEELDGEASSTQNNDPDDEVPKKRPKMKWSPEEVEALKDGVAKFGEGNWKSIKSAKGDILRRRTEGDLKDKWRNMKK